MARWPAFSPLPISVALFPISSTREYEFRFGRPRREKRRLIEGTFSLSPSSSTIERTFRRDFHAYPSSAVVFRRHGHRLRRSPGRFRSRPLGRRLRQILPRGRPGRRPRRDQRRLRQRHHGGRQAGRIPGRLQRLRTGQGPAHRVPPGRGQGRAHRPGSRPFELFRAFPLPAAADRSPHAPPGRSPRRDGRRVGEDRRLGGEDRHPYG